MKLVLLVIIVIADSLLRELLHFMERLVSLENVTGVMIATQSLSYINSFMITSESSIPV